jgi:hypothetical protein
VQQLWLEVCSSISYFIAWPAIFPQVMSSCSSELCWEWYHSYYIRSTGIVKTYSESWSIWLGQLHRLLALKHRTIVSNLGNVSYNDRNYLKCCMNHWLLPSNHRLQSENQLSGRPHNGNYIWNQNSESRET